MSEGIRIPGVWLVVEAADVWWDDGVGEVFGPFATYEAADAFALGRRRSTRITNLTLPTNSASAASGPPPGAAGAQAAPAADKLGA